MRKGLLAFIRTRIWLRADSNVKCDTLKNSRRRQLSGTLIVACRSTSSQPRYDFNEFLLLFESMLELVLFRLVPIAHFGKQLYRAEPLFAS